jgi:hypothetical protein
MGNNRVSRKLSVIAEGIRQIAMCLLAVVLATSVNVPFACAGQLHSIYPADSGSAGAGSTGAGTGTGGDGGGSGTQPAPVSAPVPYVMEKTIVDARSLLVAAGFHVVVQGDSSDSSIVVSQDVMGSAPVGSTVTITGEAAPTPTVTSIQVGYVDPQSGTYVQLPQLSQGQVPTVTQKGGRIQLLSTVYWSTGAGGYASDQGVRVSWATEDPSIATIDQTGMLTAVKDGTVKITCTDLTHGGVSSSIDVKIVGQSGAYVTEVLITDENGTSYGDSRIIFKKLDGTQSAQPYATVKYSDGTEKCTWRGDKIDNLVWSSTDSEICYVNDATGRLIPKDDGSVREVATVSGGIDGAVSGYVYVVIDTGRYNSEYWPSDTLKIQVVYASDESKVAKEKDYDVGSFSSLGLVQNAYTIITSNGHYATDSAMGVPVTTVLSDMGIDPSEISVFRLFANDSNGGSNGAQISKSYLLDRTGYYFPNMDATLTIGAVPSVPMIAICDSWCEDSTKVDYSQMNEGRRFRMVLGSSSLTDACGSKSVKFINTIKIVMSGAPPVSPGDNGNGSGNGTGSGTGNGNGTGGSGSGNGGGGNGGSGNGEGTGLLGIGLGASSSETGLSSQSGAFSAQSDEGFGTNENADDAPAGAAGESGASRWQVFEMMKKQDSDIDPIDWTNPLEPYLVPFILSIVVIGAGATGIRFRRRLGMPAQVT